MIYSPEIQFRTHDRYRLDGIGKETEAIDAPALNVVHIAHKHPGRDGCGGKNSPIVTASCRDHCCVEPQEVVIRQEPGPDGGRSLSAPGDEENEENCKERTDKVRSQLINSKLSR